MSSTTRIELANEMAEAIRAAGLIAQVDASKTTESVYVYAMRPLAQPEPDRLYQTVASVRLSDHAKPWGTIRKVGSTPRYQCLAPAHTARARQWADQTITKIINLAA